MSNIGNKEAFSKNLAYFIKKSGKSQKQICEDLGFSRSTFNEWLKGKNYPRIDKIEMLSDYFGIYKSELIEENWKTDETLAIEKALFDTRVLKDDKLMKALRVYYTLTEKQQDAIIDHIYSYKG